MIDFAANNGPLIETGILIGGLALVATAVVLSIWEK